MLDENGNLQDIQKPFLVDAIGTCVGACTGNTFIMIMFTIFIGSIAGGISAGIIAYVVIKVLAGKYKEVHPFLYILCIPLILYFIS